jgi:hypothetical protein
MIAVAPRIAPVTWAAMYAGTSRHGNLPVAASPSVTAGLMWLPEMCPSAYTVATTAAANAKEIIPRSAMVNGASPLTMSVAGTAPTPMKTRMAVPNSSAASRCGNEFSSMDPPPSVYVTTVSLRRDCRSPFDNVERDSEATPVFH